MYNTLVAHTRILTRTLTSEKIYVANVVGTGLSSFRNNYIFPYI